MKNVLFILCLLLCIGQGVVSAEAGTVAFDDSDAPEPLFQFTFSRELIALATTDERFSAVEHLSIRTYAAADGVFDAFVRYYGETLQATGWQTFAEAVGMHIYILKEPGAPGTITGIFAIVKSGEEVSLLNIVGSLAENRIAALLRRLHLLGIEIPELKSLPVTRASSTKTGGSSDISIGTGTRPPQPTPPTRTFSYTLDGGFGGPGVRFNRVTGWELGAGFDFGIPGVSVSGAQQKPRFFGEMGYGFGNRLFSYDIGVDVPPLSYSRRTASASGGTTTRNMTIGLGLRAKVFRETDVIMPHITLGERYNSPFSLMYSLFGGSDLHNYYLRNGFEIGLRWEGGRRQVPMHAVMLTFLAETHASLQKSTDWHFLNWQSERKARENPEITDGRMRSLVLQYDFSTRALKAGALASGTNHHLEDWQNTETLQDAIARGKLHHLGWHNTLFVEYSGAALRSDFDFTRYQLHLRYAYPLGPHHIRARAIGSFATAALPIQRQFVIGGPGTLNGYSLYEFAGDRGILVNVEYFHHLPSLFAGLGQPRSELPIFVVAFLDGGQVWAASGENDVSEPRGSAGIGLQFGEDNFIFRGNVAKGFEVEQGIQFNLVWFYSF